MVTASPIVHTPSKFLLLPFATLVLIGVGCGPSEEATDEEWQTEPTPSPTALLEHRVDSLQNENRRMAGQADALLAENRSLRARIADLETKLSEATTAATAAAAAPLPAAGTSGYTRALDQFMARNYPAAIRQFEALLKTGIQEDLADNCYYWLGESRYALKQYAEALRDFEKVFNYPSSGKQAAAQLMIGNTYSAMGEVAAARDAYNKVVSNYPTSALTAKAQEKLSRLR